MLKNQCLIFLFLIFMFFLDFFLFFIDGVFCYFFYKKHEVIVFIVNGQRFFWIGNGLV